MRFVFDRHKAAQAAAYLIKLNGGKLNLMALIKLLYLADRTSLIECDYPITGDKMVSMPHGPVLSQIYDAVKWGPSGEGDPWYQYISEKDGYDVWLVMPDPPRDELSDYELEVLERTHKNFGHLNQWELRGLTHDLPEWEDPHGSSFPIDPADILRAEGKSDCEIREAIHEAEDIRFLESLRD